MGTMVLDREIDEMTRDRDVDRRKSCRKSDDELQEVRALRLKVETLEADSYVLNEKVMLLVELYRVMSEYGLGRQIINKVANNELLERDEKIVLPMRKKQFIEMFSMDMPEPLKEEMINSQLKLIQRVIRHITHRRYFKKISNKKLSVFK